MRLAGGLHREQCRKQSRLGERAMDEVKPDPKIVAASAINFKPRQCRGQIEASLPTGKYILYVARYDRTSYETFETSREDGSRSKKIS